MAWDDETLLKEVLEFVHGPPSAPDGDDLARLIDLFKRVASKYPEAQPEVLAALDSIISAYAKRALGEADEIPAETVEERDELRLFLKVMERHGVLQKTQDTDDED